MQEQNAISMSIVKVNNLKKTFQETRAVDNVSFSVKKEEIFGFLGPNGAGKTTTLRMLTGLLKPDRGTVHINGWNIDKDPLKVKMKLGVIPEVSNIYKDLTPLQNILLAGRFYGIKRSTITGKAEQLLQRLGIYEQKDQPVSEFSKGMRQKVSIACALINNAEVLFLDEPTAGLDVHSRKLIREVILEMKKTGVTIFLTTHDIEEANQLCEQIAIINRGRIAAIDTPENLKRIFKESCAVEVSFDRMPPPDSLSQIEETKHVEKRGDKFRITTASPDRLIKHLASFAEKENIAFTHLAVLGTSLEEVFLTLTEEGK